MVKKSDGSWHPCGDWMHHLPLVLLSFGSASTDDHGCSSAEAVYGSSLMLHGMFLDALEFTSEILKS